MVADESFEGWVGLDVESAKGNMVWQGYKPKAFEKTDIDIEVEQTSIALTVGFLLTCIQISHCGVCGTDLHTLRSGWMPAPYPIVVGHEIVGRAVKVGKEVKSGIKVGDRVGVGWFVIDVVKLTLQTLTR